jgi:signal transduction histidine kinase
MKGSRNLSHAGYAILLYGVFAGVFPSGWHVLGIPIEIFRAISAILILHCIMRALQIFNIEQKRKIESQLRLFAQSEKMVSLGKLSAGIAHEINNPLSNVLLNVEMLEKDLNKSDHSDINHQKRIEAIKRNLERAAKIAGELLFFSHNREKELETLNLNEVIGKTFRLIESRQSLYDFQLDLENIPEIDGIPWKVEEVLLNLLMNAMEASSPGGRIELRTRVVAGRVCCTVQDHGSGIRDEDLGFVFDPFFTTKEPGEGTGLGMSICFGIMELHKGEIIINSKVNEGTVVELFFPIPERSNQ